MTFRKIFSFTLFCLLGASCMTVSGCSANTNVRDDSQIQVIQQKDETVTLGLEGTKNTRDLGGYRTSFGKTTKYRVLLRSDNTDTLTDQDMEKLKKEYNLRTVIDLRYSREIAEAPDKLSDCEGVEYRNVPIVISKQQMIALVKGNTDLGDAYIESLSQRDTIRKIFEIIANSSGGALLFHCTNGKDRTGTLAALLLGLVGVSKEDIVANYSVTYELIKNNDAVKKGIEKYGTDTVFKSEPKYIIKLIDHVIGTYGSFENYLLDCGISQQTLDIIKSKFQV